MKTSKQSFIVIILFMLTFGFNSYAQVERTITLICDTSELKTGKAYEACHFEGQKADSDTRDFTVIGNVGDNFIWKGKSSSGSDELNITKIKYYKGTKIFDKDSIIGSKTVSAKVKHNTKNKKDFSYKIFFTVNEEKKPYKIDPKVRIN